jgi:hypothetical protein
VTLQLRLAMAVRQLSVAPGATKRWSGRNFTRELTRVVRCVTNILPSPLIFWRSSISILLRLLLFQLFQFLLHHHLFLLLG